MQLNIAQKTQRRSLLCYTILTTKRPL